MLDLNGKLKLHPDFRHEVVRIGNDAAPVVVVDNFLSSEPENLPQDSRIRLTTGSINDDSVLASLPDPDAVFVGGTGRQVALKLLQKEVLADLKTMLRFQRECRA